MHPEDEDRDKPSGGTADAARPPVSPPEEEISQALNELSRLSDDHTAYWANRHAWAKRWDAGGYQFPQQILQLQQQQQQQEQQRQQQANKREPEAAAPQPSDTFSIEFAPEFAPEEVQTIAASLADYFRACGGDGLEYLFDIQEAATEKS